MTPGNSAEIRIIQKELNLDFPSDYLCIGMAQPFLRVQQTDNGLKIGRNILGIHKSMIRSVLQLIDNLRFGNTPHNINLLLFPELSLPFDMLTELKENISDSWPNNSILIGGIEGINAQEYRELLEISSNPSDARSNLLNGGNYINCGIFFVKEREGEIKIYLQPKIKASEVEQTIGMIEGEHIFLFKTTNFNFLSLICFDFIGRDRTSPVPLIQTIMRKLSSDVPPLYCLNLDLVFILQHNEDPNHRCFQEGTRTFLHEGGGRIDTRSLVFVNTANKYFWNSTKFGKSALYFPRGTWKIPEEKSYPVNHTFALETTGNGCERARFREDGPCVHSIIYIPRKALGGDSGDTRYPLVPPPLCYKIKPDGLLDEGRAVPALEKIVSDNLPLDLATKDNRWNAPSCLSLEEKMQQIYLETREKLLNVRIERMKELTDLLFTCHYSEDCRIENPDYWKTENEGEAIKELESALSILSLLGELNLDLDNKVITGLLKEEFYIGIIDGKGTETPSVIQDAYKKYMGINEYNNINLQKNILLVLCRHRGEQPSNGIAQEIANFTLISKSEESTMPPELQDKNKFTSLDGGKVFWHSRESLQGILEENHLDRARIRLEEKLVPLSN